MSNSNKFIIIVLIGIILTVFGFCNKVYHGDKTLPVSGTVYAKNEGAYSPYKSTQIKSEFWIAVHPDDPSKYNDYDVKTTFATYSNLQKGSHVTFDVYEDEVLKNYKKPSAWLMEIPMLIGGSILFLCLIFGFPLALEEM